jgi:uncharacterized protein YciI
MDFKETFGLKKALTLLLLAGTLKLPAQAQNPEYNQLLADSLQADENGMKRYVLVILKTGVNNESDKRKSDSLFAGHMANINRLAEEGLLTVAGPLGKNDRKYRGIFILNVKTIAEAKTLVQTDPAIKAKLLDPELYSWYGSAALPMYLPFSKKVEKKSF